MNALRAWEAAIEAMGIPSTNPVADVRTFKLDDRKRLGGGTVYAVETRSRGRSRIPIREISSEAEFVNQALKHIRDDVDERYYEALMAWLRWPTFDDMARVMKCSKGAAIRRFDCGLAILQSRIVDAQRG
jgi:hypothetical protein